MFIYTLLKEKFPSALINFKIFDVKRKTANRISREGGKYNVYSKKNENFTHLFLKTYEKSSNWVNGETCIDRYFKSLQISLEASRLCSLSH